MSAAVHLVAGSTGAGKTTYAIRLAAEVGGLRLSLDEWMTTLFEADRPDPIPYAWMMARIARCEAQMRDVAQAAGALGVPAVVDCGLTLAEHRGRWAAWAQAAGRPVRLHHLAAAADVRWARVQHRNADRGETYRLEVTREMFDFVETLWEPPTPDEMARLNGVEVR